MEFVPCLATDFCDASPRGLLSDFYYM
nr:hypothetical protein [Sicyoidochytrium minutum DNA virus]